MLSGHNYMLEVHCMQFTEFVKVLQNKSRIKSHWRVKHPSNDDKHVFKKYFFSATLRAEKKLPNTSRRPNWKFSDFSVHQMLVYNFTLIFPFQFVFEVKNLAIHLVDNPSNALLSCTSMQTTASSETNFSIFFSIKTNTPYHLCN